MKSFQIDTGGTLITKYIVSATISADGNWDDIGYMVPPPINYLSYSTRFSISEHVI